MGENRWSSARKAKQAERRKMQLEFEREYLMDEEEKEYFDKKRDK